MLSATFDMSPTSEDVKVDRMKLEMDRRDFLRGLPGTCNEYQYSQFQALEEIVPREYSNFLDHDHLSPSVIFKDVPPSEVAKHNEEFPGRIDYHRSLRLLVLTKPSPPHEICASAFGAFVCMCARKMGVHRSLYFPGASDVKGSDRIKQADRSFAPRGPSAPGGFSGWPTVVLEVGFSETAEKLKRDAAWWLNKSDTRVQSVVTIDIKRPSGNIYITLLARGGGPMPEELTAVQNIRIIRGRTGNHRK